MRRSRLVALRCQPIPEYGIRPRGDETLSVPGKRTKSSSAMSRAEEQLWRTMLSKSWEPRQWWDRDDNVPTHSEGKIMWVYRETEKGLWTVGYYTPGGEWHTDSDHSSKEAAAQRVHYLNGGNK